MLTAADWAIVAVIAVSALLSVLRGFVREGDAQDVGCGDAQLVSKVHIACRQGFGLPGTGPRHHPNISFRSCRRLQLLRIERFQIFHTPALLFLRFCFIL